MEEVHGGLNGSPEAVNLMAMAEAVRDTLRDALESGGELGFEPLKAPPVQETRTPPYVIGAVPVVQLDEVFPLVLPWIVAALDHAVSADMHPGLVWERIRSGDYLLLVVQSGGQLKGAAVLNRGTTRQGRPYIGVVACGGVELEHWLDMLVSEVKRLARLAGGAQILILGRPGWSRVLAKHGTSIRAVVLACDDIAE